MYKAERIDTDKALDAISQQRMKASRDYTTKLLVAEAYRDGYNAALDFAEGMFECSNYERTEEGSE